MWLGFLKYPLLFSVVVVVVSAKSAAAQNMSMQNMPGMDFPTSKAKRPVNAPSNEATKKQLALARAEGDAVDQCTAWIVQQAGNMAGTLNAGEYKITYAITSPEGWYSYNNNSLSWQPPSDANAHLWLFVQDGADGRIVPPLNITAQIKDSRGNSILSKNLPFAWMPLINGYGDNINLPGDENYTLQVQINPPQYHRHDPYNGDRFTDVTKAEIPVTVSLSTLTNLKPLSEAMEQQKTLSQNAGNAYANTLKNMFKQANDGRDTVLNDYKVAFAVEYAEGYWDYEHGIFRYKVENDLSGRTNGHVEVAVLDAKTGRFLHDLNVTATLNKDGKDIGTKVEPFMWHPWLYHYGENWRVPSAGKYDLHIHFDPPPYRRYGKNDGRQFARSLDFNFNNIKIKTGQK